MPGSGMTPRQWLLSLPEPPPHDHGTTWSRNRMDTYARRTMDSYPPPEPTSSLPILGNVFNNVEAALLRFEDPKDESSVQHGYHSTLSQLGLYEQDAGPADFEEPTDLRANAIRRERARVAANMRSFPIPLFLADCIVDPTKRAGLDSFMGSYRHYAREYFFPPFAPSNHTQLKTHIEGQRELPYRARYLAQGVLWWSGLVAAHGNMQGLGSPIVTHYQQVASILTMLPLPDDVTSRAQWHKELLLLKVGDKKAGLVDQLHQMISPNSNEMSSLLAFITDKATREYLTALHAIVENTTPVFAAANLYQYGQGEGLRKETLRRVSGVN